MPTLTQTKVISLTTTQINILLAETRITKVVEIMPSGNVIVSCQDGFKRQIAFLNHGIDWIDSYN